MNGRLDVRVFGGNHMIVQPSEVTGRMLATSGVGEPHTTALFRNHLALGDVCVDLGANLGFFTLLAAKLVGPIGHVYAVEPAPDVYAALLENLELNCVSNVTALEVAAGAAVGEAVLYDVQGGNAGASSIRRGPDETTDISRMRPPTTVRVLPVTHIVAPHHLPRLRLIKIDVEGAEADVLRGLEPLFERGLRPALAIEMHQRIAPEAPAVVVDFCNGYALKAHKVVDERYAERTWAATHVTLRDVSPSELTSIDEDSFYVLLTDARAID
jgi:FkbM family methyltransferase